MEISINALAALVRRGWTVTMNRDGIWYDRNGINVIGDWLTIPEAVERAVEGGK